MPSVVRPARVLRIAEHTMSQPTAPYREGAVIGAIRSFVATRHHLAVEQDRDGNIQVRRRGVPRSRAPLVLAAHMDHPGFRALRSRRIAGGQLVDALFLGGVRPEYFQGARVRFFGNARVVRARVRATRRNRRSGAQHVTLDAHEPVPANALGMWDLPPFRRSRRDPDLLESRAADDLAGVAACLALLDVVDRIDPARRVDVRGLFTRAEEVGFVGALAVASAGRLPAQTRLVTLEASKALPAAPQGGGPVLRVGDRTSVFDDALTRWIARVGIALAGPQGRRFGWQRRLMDGGTCESTAYQLYGYRSAALCLPLGNYHNMADDGRIGVESIRLSDLVGLVRLLEGMVRHDHDAPRAGSRDPLRTRLEARFRRARQELAREPAV